MDAIKPAYNRVDEVLMFAAEGKRCKRKARNLKNKANKGFVEFTANNREGGPRNGRRKDA